MVLWLIVAWILFAVGWAAALLLGRGLQQEMGRNGAAPQPAGIWPIAVALAVSLVGLPLAIGLLKRQNWAWAGSLVVLPALPLICLVSSLQRGLWWPFLVTAGELLLFSMWAMVYLLRPAVKAWLRGQT